MRALFKGLVWLTLILGAIVGILRATCISFWTIPGDDALFSLSIMPTLEAGDLVVLWRVGAPVSAISFDVPIPKLPKSTWSEGYSASRATRLSRSSARSGSITK